MSQPVKDSCPRVRQDRALPLSHVSFLSSVADGEVFLCGREARSRDR